MKTYSVTVTEDDILNGKPGCGSDCPVALALRRATGLPIHVGLDAFFNEQMNAVLAPAIESVTAFILQLDAYGGVGCKPFTFEITL